MNFCTKYVDLCLDLRYTVFSYEVFCMEKLSVVFFSNNNVVLGNTLKREVNRIGFELTYSNALNMVLDIASNSGRAVVFVDKVYSKHIELISQLTKCKCFSNILIAFVDNDKTPYCDYESARLFVVPESHVEQSVSTVLQSCRECIDTKLRINMRVVSDILTGYLSKLGFSPKHSGYRYIKQCVEYAVQNSFDIGKSLYKETYLVICKRNNETVAAIERNIRNAISQACLNSGFTATGFEILQERKVTNRMFLSFLVDKLSTDERIYVLDKWDEE